MGLSITGWDRRLPNGKLSSLEMGIEALLEADRSVGNIVPSAPDLRQIVNIPDRRRWYVSRQPQRASRPGLSQSMQPKETPIYFEGVRARGRQCWLRFSLNDCDLVALSNPNPHIEGTVTITTVGEDLQTWSGSSPAETKDRIKRIVTLGVDLARRLSGRYISFNNLDAGNSLSQFHFSLNNLPPGVLRFPVEELAEREDQPEIFVAITEPADYPVPTIIWEGKAEDITRRMCEAIIQWDQRPHSTGNLLFRETTRGTVRGVFWPRIRTWRRAPGFLSGEIAFLELGGYFLLSDAFDLEQTERGNYDYDHFSRVLAAVSDPAARDWCLALKTHS